jgi:hypothetical protein
MIGAATVSSPEAAVQDSRADSLPVSPGQWSLCSFLDIGSDNDNSSRSQVVVLESMLNQYADKGLSVCVIAENPRSTAGAIENHSYDWHAENISFLGDPTARMAESHSVITYPTTLLFSPNGREVSRWSRFASAIELGLKLRKLLGAPSGTADIEEFGN